MKHYEKPQLFMEEFTMTENIARCGMNNEQSGENWLGMKANFYADRETCSIEYDEPSVIGGGHVSIFMHSACQTIFDQDYFEFGCYQSDIGGGLELFGS